MPQTFVNVTGPVTLPLGRGSGSSISFTLSHWDYQANGSLVIEGPYTAEIDEDGNFSIQLMSNTSGTSDTYYNVEVRYKTSNNKFIRSCLGPVLVTDAPNQSISTLLTNTYNTNNKESLHFIDRESLVSAVDEGVLNAFPDNTLVTAGLLSFRTDSSLHVIHDLPGLFSDSNELISLRHHGALGYGNDDTVAANSAVIEYGHRLRTQPNNQPTYFMDIANLTLTNEIDFGGVLEEGDGVIIEGTTTIYPSSFGPEKAVFRVDQGGDSWVVIRGRVHIEGEGNLDDPMGLYCPNLSAHTHISNFSSNFLSSPLVVSYKINGATFYRVYAKKGKGQLTERSMEGTVGAISGNQISVWSQDGTLQVQDKLTGMEGRPISIQLSDDPSDAFMGTIISVSPDGHNATLDGTSPITVLKSELRNINFQPITCSGEVGSTTVTVTKTDPLPSELVGRYVFIKNSAGEDGTDYHVTKVVGVTSDTIQLEDPIKQDVDEETVFTGVYFILGPKTVDRLTTPQPTLEAIHSFF